MFQEEADLVQSLFFVSIYVDQCQNYVEIFLLNCLIINFMSIMSILYSIFRKKNKIKRVITIREYIGEEKRHTTC